MKLLRYGAVGAEKPGMLAPDGSLRDLSGVIADLDAAALSPEGLAKLKALKPESLPKVAGNPRLGPPVAKMGKFIAIGLNYSDHAAETGATPPTEPIVFFKADTSLAGPNDPVVIPRGSVKTDWEVELAVIIGSTARYVSVHDAPAHIAGYAVCNDVSERAYQLERGGTWDKGKGCDSFGPLGPWLVTSDEVGDPQALDMWLDVNGQREQTGSTKTMIFAVDHIVSYVSHFMTLRPGDVITTGTPPGVGMGKKPPRFLKAGDEIRLGIAKLGEQRQRVLSWEEANR
jgi:2-keto-4-pentenoate hydratase/2-oxohepta-3-ene-1,7-dioic acid hydratase in catechol pathway